MKKSVASRYFLFLVLFFLCSCKGDISNGDAISKSSVTFNRVGKKIYFNERDTSSYVEYQASFLFVVVAGKRITLGVDDSGVDFIELHRRSEGYIPTIVTIDSSHCPDSFEFPIGSDSLFVLMKKNGKWIVYDSTRSAYPFDFHRSIRYSSLKSRTSL